MTAAGHFTNIIPLPARLGTGDMEKKKLYYNNYPLVN